MSSENNPGGSVKPMGTLTQALNTYRKCFGDHYNRYSFVKEFCKGKRVLDYGCGHGFSALILEHQYLQYVGVDLDIDAINWAKANIGKKIPMLSSIHLLNSNSRSQAITLMLLFLLKLLNIYKIRKKWLNL